MAVLPGRQGTGIAAALLDPATDMPPPGRITDFFATQLHEYAKVL